MAHALATARNRNAELGRVAILHRKVLKRILSPLCFIHYDYTANDYHETAPNNPAPPSRRWRQPRTTLGGVKVELL